MGACFHIAGVTCDNCRPFTGTIIGGPITNTGRSIGDLMGDYAPPLATAAEVAALRAEVERLTEAVKGLQAIKHLRDCRSCRRWVTFTAEQLIGGWLRCPHCDIGATPDEWEPK